MHHCYWSFCSEKVEVSPLKKKIFILYHGYIYIFLLCRLGLMKIPLIVPPLLIVRLHKIKFRWYIVIGALRYNSKFELKFDRLIQK